MLIKNRKLLFTLGIILFPIFSRYASGIPYLTVAEVGMMIIIFISLFNGNRIIIEKHLVVFLLYLAVSIFIAFILGRASFDLIGSSLRLIYYYAIITFFSKGFFDLEKGKELISIVGVVLGIYGIMQLLLSLSGIYLPVSLPFFKSIDGRDYYEILMQRIALGIRYRPQSIFNEPAHFCSYLLVALVIVLFSEKRMKRWKIYSFIITVACTVSLSSTGIICEAIIWFIYLWDQVKTGKVSKKIFTSLIIISIGAIYFLIKCDIWQYFVYRTFGSSGSISGISESTRFIDLKLAFNNMNSFSSILFGNGIVELDGYLPGYARLFNCLGVIGLAIMIWVMGKHYYLSKGSGKKVALLYMIINLGTEVMFGNFLVLYLPFIICSSLKMPRSDIVERNSNHYYG